MGTGSQGPPATTERVVTCRLRPGDLVTEVDTPHGPFYRVLEASDAWLVLDAGAAPDETLPVRLPTRPADAVLRVVG